MGCCISKCRPKTPSPKACSHVEDKLVISQAPTALPTKKIPQCTTTYSSPSCTTTVSSSSCSFSKSPLSSSSTCSSSYSNSNYTSEFLKSFVKENPHYSVKTSPVKSVTVKLPAPANKSVVLPVKVKQQNEPQHFVSSVPQKRARSPSPTLHRQNSFRREPERNHTGTNSFPQRNLGSSSPSIRFYSDTSEPERPHVTNSVPRRSVVSSSPSRRFHSDVSEPDRPHSVTTSVPRRNCLVSSSPSRRFGSDISEHDIQQPLTNSLPRRYLSSSSPSRRFNSDTNREIQKNRPKESCNNNEATSKKNAASVCSSARNKENVCPSPWNNAMRDGSSMKKTETCTYKIDPGADQDAVGQMLSKHDWDSLPIDDIDNPLIALDCFIFL